MGEVADIIEKKLVEALQPVRLEVIDESYLHEGHAGARPEGETHFRIEVASDKFDGLSRIECHRMIHEILADELAGPVHALAVGAKVTEKD